MKHNMKKIVIISSSIRNGRMSSRAALYFKNFINTEGLANAEIIDLAVLDFPLFQERYKYLQTPPESLKAYAKSINSADGIIIVTPEYNGSFPASLKNAIDVLYDEWYRKPIALVSVSSGAFGASQVLMQLSAVLWKMKAQLVPTSFPIAMIDKTFDENGVPANKELTDARAKIFIGELMKSVL